MKLVITIDTEEDNWGDYRSSGYTLENIGRIPRLQDLFDRFDVKPTYLVTYPVANNEKALAMLKGIANTGRCEIGAHCHPWNTPPFEEERTARNSMLCNLPSDLQYRKLRRQHQEIEQNFRVSSVSFRAGRWGYNQSVSSNLIRLKYKVDTSVTAYTDWSIYCGPDFSNIPPSPYTISANGCLTMDDEKHLTEIPATVGYIQPNFSICNYSHKTLTGKPWSLLKMHAVLSRANLLNKVSLSPELANSRDMIRLTETMISKGFPVINMFFHSTSLMAGLSPFVKTKKDESAFFRRIREFISYSKNRRIESVTLSEAAAHIKSDEQSHQRKVKIPVRPDAKYV